MRTNSLIVSFPKCALVIGLSALILHTSCALSSVTSATASISTYSLNRSRAPSTTASATSIGAFRFAAQTLTAKFPALGLDEKFFVDCIISSGATEADLALLLQRWKAALQCLDVDFPTSGRVSCTCTRQFCTLERCGASISPPDAVSAPADREWCKTYCGSTTMRDVCGMNWQVYKEPQTNEEEHPAITSGIANLDQARRDFLRIVPAHQTRWEKRRLAFEVVTSSSLVRPPSEEVLRLSNTTKPFEITPSSLLGQALAAALIYKPTFSVSTEHDSTAAELYFKQEEVRVTSMAEDSLAVSEGFLPNLDQLRPAGEESRAFDEVFFNPTDDIDVQPENLTDGHEEGASEDYRATFGVLPTIDGNQTVFDMWKHPTPTQITELARTAAHTFEALQRRFRPRSSRTSPKFKVFSLKELDALFDDFEGYALGRLNATTVWYTADAGGLLPAEFRTVRQLESLNDNVVDVDIGESSKLEPNKFIASKKSSPRRSLTFRLIDPNVSRDLGSSTLVPLPYDAPVSGGRFTEIYYWDTLWVVRGLAAAGLFEPAMNLVRNLLHGIDKFGFVPNGMRYYYLDRSDPPVLVEMVRCLTEALTAAKKHSEAAALLRQALPRLLREYFGFWMNPATQKMVDVDTGEAVPDGSPAIGLNATKIIYTPNIIHMIVNGGKRVLNRYEAALSAIRPESAMADLEIVQDLKRANREQRTSDILRAIRSAAESGWDFSSRWHRVCVEEGPAACGCEASAKTPPCLGSRCACASTKPGVLSNDFWNTSSLHGLGSTLGVDSDNRISFDPAKGRASYFEHLVVESIIPADLNGLLYRNELTLARFCEWYGRHELARMLRSLARKRENLMRQESFDGTFFRDIFLLPPDRRTGDKGTRTMKSKVLNAGAIVALWAGLNDNAAESTFPTELIRGWGLVPTPYVTGEQWDAPNVWPPLVQMAAEVLDRNRAGIWNFSSTPSKKPSVSCQSRLGAALAARFVSNCGAFAARQKGFFPEKLDALQAGRQGWGGEYASQLGFGWTNGVILELVARYGPELLASMGGTAPIDRDIISDGRVTHCGRNNE